jgi:hypothetical protein
VTTDKSARAIFIANIIQTEDFESSLGGMITIDVSGLRNPFTNEASSSFEVQTFNFD